MRRRILAISRSIGVEPQLRSLQRALETPTARKNRRDDAHLRVLMAGALRVGSNCIDVGANVGEMTALISRLAPEGDHTAVEPLPELAAQLEREHPNVDVHCCALSDATGSRTFFRDVKAPSRSGFRRQSPGRVRGAEEFEVDVKRLDDLVPPDRPIAFIKIDVEGAEAEVLRGAMGTLKRWKPLIALEHGASAINNFDTSHRTIHDLLTGAGLAVFDMEGNGPLTAEDFDRVANPPGDRWNFFARPR
jgi:FkbM family methyltransferase